LRSAIQSRCGPIRCHEILFLAFIERSRALFGDLVIPMGGRRLDSRQRLFLLRECRLKLESEVKDAESYALSTVTPSGSH
jgi:hypothetical protein